MASQAYDKALQLDSSNSAAKSKLSLVRELIVGGGGTRPPKPATTPRTEVARAEPPRIAQAAPKSEPSKAVQPAPKAEPATPAQAAPKAKGAKTVGGDKRSGGTVSAPPEDDAPTLADLGLTKKESAVAQKLAALPEAEFQQVRDGHVAVSKAIAAVTATKPKPVAPTEPEKPADRMADLERERDAAVREMNKALADNTSMGEAFDADDRTAALFAENQKLRAQVKQLRLSLAGQTNKNNELIVMVKSLQARLKKAEVPA